MLNNSNIPQTFPEDIQATIDKLTDLELDGLLSNLKKRKGLVIEFNLLMSCLFECKQTLVCLVLFRKPKLCCYIY